jgi:hypothetical protein
MRNFFQEVYQEDTEKAGEHQTHISVNEVG